jgi:hypothetical protein
MSDDLEPMIDGKPLTQRELLLAINGKLDVIVAKQAALEKADADHETRIRAIENGHYVSWTAFWSGLAGAATVAGGIAALFGHITFTN